MGDDMDKGVRKRRR